MSLKVFMSYKWESETRNAWVEKLATDLRNAGMDVILDRWQVRFGDSFTDYMTSKISEADVVLFVITNAAVAAVEAPQGQGGAVKFEMQMATARRTAGENMRLIGIYREGSETPAHLRDHKYADFREDSKYEERLRELVDDLLGKAVNHLFLIPLCHHSKEYVLIWRRSVALGPPTPLRRERQRNISSTKQTQLS